MSYIAQTIAYLGAAFVVMSYSLISDYMSDHIEQTCSDMTLANLGTVVQALEKM